MSDKQCIIECSEVKVNLCGLNYDFVADVQKEFKKQHKRHLSMEKAIIKIISDARERDKPNPSVNFGKHLVDALKEKVKTEITHEIEQSFKDCADSYNKQFEHLKPKDDGKI